jgi:hypothetical protein
MTRDAELLVGEYREAAVEYGSALAAGRSFKANRCHDKMDRLVEELVESSSGEVRDLIPLLEDVDVWVRLCAGVHAIGVAPDQAHLALTGVANSGVPLAGFTASAVLSKPENAQLFAGVLGTPRSVAQTISAVRRLSVMSDADDGGAVEGAGRFHNLVVNGGFLHAVEALSSDELAEAAGGFALLGLPAVGELMVASLETMTGPLSVEEEDAIEEESGAAYAALVPSDGALEELVDALRAARFGSATSDGT